MGIILPGSGDAAGDSIIVPGGRRAPITGPTTSYPVTDADVLFKLRRSQEGGHLRHHAEHAHICACADTGFICCLHCGELTFDVQDAEAQANFVAYHAGCKKCDLMGSVGEIVVAD